MRRPRFEHLPAPLAYVASRYQYGGATNVLSQLTLFEFCLMFLEHLLRAQTQVTAGLRTPESLGSRTARIRELIHRLNSDGTPAIVGIPTDFDEIVSPLLILRNQWVHGRSRDKYQAADRQHFDVLMRGLFDIFASVTILLKPLDAADEHSFRDLSGTRGLFEPPMIELGTQVPHIIGGELIAFSPKIAPIVLSPFMRWRKGDLGENRIELLATMTTHDFHYVDLVGDLNTR